MQTFCLTFWMSALHKMFKCRVNCSILDVRTVWFSSRTRFAQIKILSPKINVNSSQNQIFTWRKTNKNVSEARGVSGCLNKSVNIVPPPSL